MTTSTPHPTLASSLDQFIRGLDKSPWTIQAYHADIQQFITWLSENDMTVTRVHHVTRSHVIEYLNYLANQGRTDTTRARKLVSLHVFFTYLVKEGVLPHSPASMVKRPCRERKPKHMLRPDEFRRIVAEARGNPRDYALLQLLMQTGIRVSELIAIRTPELDLEHQTLTIHDALQSYLVVRAKPADQHLFLNYQGQGLSIGGVRKLMEKYAKRAGITKKISCHGLHYTFASNRATLEMIAFSLKTPLRHERMRTSKKKVSLGTEELRKLMEFTSL